MSKDQFQDRYNEIFQEMKDEKMNWNFEDFLKKTESEETAPIIPIGETKKPGVPKLFWMAASIVLLFGIFFGIRNWKSQSDIENQNTLVQNQIRQQKGDIIKENNFAFQDPQDSISGKSTHSFIEDSLTNEVSSPEKVMNQIAPKRGRLLKTGKQKYAENAPKIQKQNAKETYEDNYVIVNGYKIKNEEEAINVAKYSFQMLSENVSKSVASSVVQEYPTDN